MIDVTTTFAVISWKKEVYRNMIADKIKNARTILYYIRTMCDVRSRMKNELEYRVNEKQENSILLKE